MFGCHHGLLFFTPMRIDVAVLSQVFGQTFDPADIDFGDRSSVTPAGFNDFCGNDPLWFRFKDARPRPQIEFDISRAGVFAFFGQQCDAR